jgi:hypothetical protein
MATNGSKQTERRPEGKEGAGAQQEGRQSEQGGQTNRRASGDNQKHERAIRQHGESKSAGRKQHVGGQGMGQGRGMNAGEVHENDPGDENDQKD